jgi:cyclohexanone monooxygenase
MTQRESFMTTTTTADPALSFDPSELRSKYAEERAKRIRADGKQQYRKVAGQFGDFAKDPHVETIIERAPLHDEVDVLLIGGGFSGLMTGARLRKVGVESIRIVERGGDVGGTWYWNRYPGAACDIDSTIYMPMLEDIGDMPSRKYPPAPELLEHARKIARKYDLYRDAVFQTAITDLKWDEASERWKVHTNRDDVMTARYVVMGLGPLAQPKLPGIPGIETFKGKAFHTSRWDYSYTGGSSYGGLEKLTDKRVGIIGTGATAIQCLPHLAESAMELYSFQRTPSSVDIRGDRPTDPEWWTSLQPGWQRERMVNFTNLVNGTPQDVDLVNDGWTHNFLDARDENVEGVDAAQMANFRKMESVRQRIGEIVDDPKTAEALKPWYNYFCKRPCFNDYYLQAFNQPNVHLVDTDGRGVKRIDETGIWAGGQHYDLDCIVFSTGFEVGTGFLSRSGFDVTGKGGLTMTQHWKDGVRTLHGMLMHGFPNLFMIGGIDHVGLNANHVHMLDEQTEYVVDVITGATDGLTSTFELSREAEQDYVDTIIYLATRNPMAPQNGNFQQECTPGYYNNEGNLDGVPIQSGPYGGGPMAYFKALQDWRKAGDFPGLIVNKAP